ncbi:MAG: flippase-like domain-containing protein [Deltaproteobacteria bacterium]|nr:flippase-like domain-containing protein [Deltaproteobacteria bacterium]
MTRARSRRALTALQYALCLAAVAYLVQKVPWYSHVRLEGPNGARVRLLEQRGDQLLIERAGRPEFVPAALAQHATVEGRQVPQIEIGVRDVVRRLKASWALYALLLFAPVLAIQAYRLVLMVAVQRVRLPLWSAAKLNLAGNFFNFALPGTTGGDLIKAYYLSRYTHLKTEVITTVFLDRVIGLVGLVGVALGAMAVTGDLRISPRVLAISAVAVVGAGGVTAALFSRRFRRRFRLAEWVGCLPGGAQLLRVGRAALALRESKGRVAAALALTFALQGIGALSAAAMAWAIGMRGPGGAVAQIWYFTAYVSAGFLVAALPLTPQGIGVMEAAYVHFFTQGGWNSASQAVVFAFAVRLIQLVWALPGVLVPLFGAHLPPREELEALARDGDAECRR